MATLVECVCAIVLMGNRRLDTPQPLLSQTAIHSPCIASVHPSACLPDQASADFRAALLLWQVLACLLQPS